MCKIKEGISPQKINKTLIRISINTLPCKDSVFTKIFSKTKNKEHMTSCNFKLLPQFLEKY